MSGASAQRHPEDVGWLTIQQVSRLLDVPAPTIRSWERRYGLPPTVRTTAGHRRYNQAQVQVLRRVRDAIGRGLTAREAATLAKTAKMRSEVAQPLIDALLEGARQLNPHHIARTLDSAHRVLGLGVAIDDVLLPAMRRIGRDWQTGRCDVAHEHLTTETARAWLTRTSPDTPPTRQRQPIILTCGPEDQHTLGLESLAALLRQGGLDCRLLGASVPAASLAAAVHRTEPSAIVLVCHLSIGRRSAVDALRAATASIHTANLHRTHIFYAGHAFQASGARHNVPGTYLGDDLAHAADLITARLGST